MPVAAKSINSSNKLSLVLPSISSSVLGGHSSHARHGSLSVIGSYKSSLTPITQNKYMPTQYSSRNPFLNKKFKGVSDMVNPSPADSRSQRRSVQQT